MPTFCKSPVRLLAIGLRVIILSSIVSQATFSRHTNLAYLSKPLAHEATCKQTALPMSRHHFFLGNLRGGGVISRARCPTAVGASVCSIAADGLSGLWV